jgi:hypothetical protein
VEFQSRYPIEEESDISLVPLLAAKADYEPVNTAPASNEADFSIFLSFFVIDKFK